MCSDWVEKKTLIGCFRLENNLCFFSSRKIADASSVAAAPGDIFLGRGIVEAVLDENFGIIFGPLGSDFQDRR